jgi:hypothetical protein
MLGNAVTEIDGSLRGDTGDGNYSDGNYNTDGYKKPKDRKTKR